MGFARPPSLCARPARLPVSGTAAKPPPARHRHGREAPCPPPARLPRPRYGCQAASHSSPARSPSRLPLVTGAAATPPDVRRSGFSQNAPAAHHVCRLFQLFARFAAKCANLQQIEPICGRFRALRFIRAISRKALLFHVPSLNWGNERIQRLSSNIASIGCGGGSRSLRENGQKWRKASRVVQLLKGKEGRRKKLPPETVLCLRRASMKRLAGEELQSERGRSEPQGASAETLENNAFTRKEPVRDSDKAQAFDRSDRKRFSGRAFQASSVLNWLQWQEKKGRLPRCSLFR